MFRCRGGQTLPSDVVCQLDYDERCEVIDCMDLSNLSNCGKYTCHCNRGIYIFFIKVYVPFQKSERSCICVVGVSILSLSTILIFYFGVVPCGIIFGFILSNYGNYN